MSTTFTISSPLPAADLPLGQLLVNAQQWVFLSLLNLMAIRGQTEVSATHLAFLANLDCGETHASSVARRTGVTRQAVYRTTRELQALGILILENDPTRRNQKLIRMTPKGMTVIADARQCLAEVEDVLKTRIGENAFSDLTTILRGSWGSPLGRNS